MRILQVITSLKTGGAEHLMVELLPRLCSDGHNNVDILVFDGTRTLFMDLLESKGFRIIKLRKGGYVYDPLNIYRMIRYISHYDIIHTHNTACQFYVPVAQLMSFKRKCLVTTEHSTNNRRRSKWWFRPIDKWVYNRYEAIVCISDRTRSNLEAYIGRNEKTHVIENGVDVQRFFRPVKRVSSSGDYVVVMVAGMRPEKDHETLLRAMANLPANYRLLLVGGGVTENALKTMTEQLGLSNRVVFMGVRTDVPDILEKADVAVLSSHWEGFGLAAVEAMAAGKPTIASDVDGLREVVVGAGLLFPPGDYLELANEIRQLCENPDEYEKIAHRCQERARRFDVNKMAKAYIQLYDSLSKLREPSFVGNE